MATYFSDLQTLNNGPAFGNNPQTRVKVNRQHGRIRFMESTFVTPAGGLAIADKIVWGKLPQKSKILGHLSQLRFTVGTASATLNLGDSIVPARHLAATSIATAGTATPNVADITQSTTGNITTGSTLVTGLTSLGGISVGYTISGTGIPAGATVAAIDLMARTLTLSAAATATTAALAITVVGGAYETQDDSNSVGNNFASTTDDCTLQSVLAGAGMPAGQVVTLKVAYVND